MTRLMIIVGSVRPGRVGLPVAQWVRDQVTANSDFEIDFVDLAELDLPLMDEPNHPRLHAYTKPNAIDYLNSEWWRKPVGVISYGGASGGTRSAASLAGPFAALGLVKLGANIEINFVGTLVRDGVFHPTDKEVAILDKMIAEFGPLSEALAPLR